MQTHEHHRRAILRNGNLNGADSQLEIPPLTNHKRATEIKQEMRISRAMEVATSALYCVKLMAIGLSFPLAYLVMYNTEEAFGFTIYRGYPIYLYTVGIIFQTLYLTQVCSKQCSLFEKNCSSNRANEIIASRAFGSKGLRLLTAAFGVVSSFWFLLLFAWLLDMLTHHFRECQERQIEAVVFGLAFIYTIMHIFVLFFNTQLLTSGHEIFVLFGIMHLIGTDISTFGWTSAHFTVLTVTHLTPANKTHAHCDFGSPLATVVYSTHSYLGVFVLIYFLVSSSVLFAAFAYHYENGDFNVSLSPPSNAAVPVGRDSTTSNNSCASTVTDNRPPSNSRTKLTLVGAYSKMCSRDIIPGMCVSLLALCLAVLFVIYHYRLINDRENLSAFLMDLICIIAKLLAFACCTILLIIDTSYQQYRTSVPASVVLTNPNLNRRILFEALVLSVSLFVTYLHDLCKLVINFRLGDYYADWRGLDGLTGVLEITVQSTFLLNALKYDNRRFAGARRRRLCDLLQKNLVVYLMTHNFIMAVLAVMQQSDETYGRTFSELFNVWFWSSFKFYINSFVVLYRLYSTVFFGSLLLRHV